MKKIMVTNAGGRLGVGVTRALRAAPEPIHLIGVDAHPVQLHRAEVDEKHLVPRALDEDYIPILRSLVEDTGADFLWVNNEAEIAIVAKNSESIGVKTFLPSFECISLCQDKMAFNQQLNEAGVSVPTSILINSRADLGRAFCQFGPRIWLRAITGTGGKGSLPTSEFETATRWIDLHHGWGNFMAAPCLTDETATWESIWDRGELIAAQSRKRLYWEFSSSTFSGVTGVGGAHQWIVDPLIAALGVQAVKAIDSAPHGIFSVDMTYDHQGMPKVTEINGGRFMSGGSVCYFTSDYNLAFLVVQTAFGEEPSTRVPAVDVITDNNLLVHGVDVEPVFLDSSEVDRCADELQLRRAVVQANSTRLGMPAAAR